MKKFFLPLLLVALCSRIFAVSVETLPLDANYEMTEQGYLDAPMQTAAGLILTDNRQSAVYLLEKDQLVPLLNTPGCGRYTELNADKTLLGFKLIDERGLQAPAVLNLKTREVKQLAPFADQCGQVSFAADGTLAYTIGHTLVISGNEGTKEIPLGFYTNIVRLSPDGSMIATSNHEGQPLVFDLASMQMSRLSTEVELYNPRWSADSRRLVYEQSNMTLYTFDLTTGAGYCLGKGFGAHWLNCDQLLYSRTDYVDNDNFACLGIAVCRNSFDGKKPQDIIPASFDCPQEIGLMSDGRIAVPFAYGERRIELLDLRSGNSSTLFSLPSDRQLAFRAMPEEVSVLNAETGNTVGGPLNWEEIPYINQVHDVPPYGTHGYAYGPCACAPSTSCMVLGFYGLLDPHPINSRSGAWGAINNYSWYVGQVYTHPATGYTFDAVHMSSCGGDAAGGYGFMWYYGSPASMMGQFYLNNNCPNATYDYTGLTAIRAETEIGFPFSWCITSTRTNGHLILPFRHDCAYKKVDGVYTYVASNGSVVVHDPYGNANNSTWGGSDGRHITYDCSGYNNGYLQMVNAWGVKVHISRTPNFIEYELNGGHFTEDVPTVYYSDLRLPTPEKEGATFQGWFVDRTYTGTRMLTLVPNSGIDTLYALWSDMPLVRYYLNGGSMPEGVVLPTVIEETYTLPIPERTGFTFTGWFWSTDLLGDPVTVLNPGDEGKLYATWTRSVGLENVNAEISYLDHTILNPNGLMLHVYTADGQLVMQGKSDLSLERMPAGMYIVRAADTFIKVMR